jgi:alkanesulfonate monooxygenase SsuD/methylene tetrahydromethanopterin reductase-like flavin-dependent oxidoreductase (luciferase family)
MIKIGFTLINHFTPGTDVTHELPLMLDQVRAARDSGLHSLWLGQHYLMGQVPYFSYTPLIARLIPEAGDMVVGPCIQLLPLYNPVTVAEEAATLDVLSGGRYVLGIGLGYRQEECDAFGIGWGERAARMTESVEVIRRLWSEETIDHDGRFYKVDGQGTSLKPVQKPGPPIWVAAVAEPAIKRAARIGDAWVILVTVSFEELKDQVPMYLEAVKEAGKPAPPEIPITRDIHIADQHANAWDECREGLARKYGIYNSLGLNSSEGASASIEEFAKDRFFIGDKEAVKDQILRYNEELGINHFIMRVQWPGHDHETTMKCLDRLGEIAADIC